MRRSSLTVGLLTHNAFKHPSNYKEKNQMLPIFGLTALLIIGLLAWLTNRAVKNSLSKKLGRKVKDHEVTSLSAWMNADDKK